MVTHDHLEPREYSGIGPQVEGIKSVGPDHGLGEVCGARGAGQPNACRSGGGTIRKNQGTVEKIRRFAIVDSPGIQLLDNTTRLSKGTWGHIHRKNAHLTDSPLLATTLARAPMAFLETRFMELMDCILNV